MVGASCLSLGRTIFHLEACGARGVLVVPYWPSAVFWPIVFPSSGHRASIVQCIEFSDPCFVFAPAREGHETIFCPSGFRSSVLALCLDGSSRFS